MADKNGRERLSMYFKGEKEMKLWDYINEKYSKSAFVKEAIEEKMLRELAGVKVPEKKSIEKSATQTNEVNEETKKIKLNNDDKKSLNSLAGGF